MDLFITKNKKLDRLITYSPSITPGHKIPIINLLTIYLNQKELNQLKMGLDYSFVDKNKRVKGNIAASMESAIEAVDKDIDIVFTHYCELTQILFQKTYVFQWITHTTT